LAPILLSGRRASPRSISIHSQHFAEPGPGEDQELDSGNGIRGAVMGSERVAEEAP
jgi:hypothetical protein